MSGMTGGSMLRTRKKDASIKPNRRLDRKSSRGMLYENEELRLRTININAEVERGQTDIKKLRRENEQLRREVGALRGEYDRLEKLLKSRHQEELSDAEVRRTIGSRSTRPKSEERRVPQCCAPGLTSARPESGSYCSDCDNECTRSDSSTQHEYGKDDKIINSESCCERTQAPTECCVRSCGMLTVVQEEPLQKISNATDPQTSNSEKYNSSSSPTELDYYKAVVTVPLESHTTDSAVIFPKTGLDVLINNNDIFQNFEGYTVVPPIGFIIPSSINDDYFQNIVSPTNDMSNLKIVPVKNNNENNCSESITSENSDSVNDSFLVCNTRQIIKKLTVQNTNNLENIENLEINPDPVVDDDTKQSFRTEKNIELYYDYPKPYVENDASEFKNFDLTQSMQTTTEIKSTIMLFERKNKANRSRNKPPFFGRSQSVPVESLMGEPIYATVKKLPNKFEHMHITKLENEIKYIPPENNEELKDTEIEPTIEDAIETNDSAKPEDVNESSETTEEPPPIHIIPKSPIARKKKRFTIHFKLKGNKKRNAQKIIENPIDVIKLPDDSTSAPETPDNIKNKNTESNISCRKHNSGTRTKSNCPCRRVHQNEKCLIHRRNSTKDCEHKKRYSPVRNYFKHDSFQEITSHSERERTNSLSSSGHSGFSLTAKQPHKMKHAEGSIPWCGCWGNSCL